jgi:hypothetical protein
MCQLHIYFYIYIYMSDREEDSEAGDPISMKRLMTEICLILGDFGSSIPVSDWMG